MGDALRAVRRQLGTPAPSVFERVRAVWPEVVGDALARHSAPLHLRAGVLRVGVDDPAWGGQFRYLADTLVTALAERVPEAAIREISVTAGRPGAGPRAPRRRPPTSGRTGAANRPERGPETRDRSPVRGTLSEPETARPTRTFALSTPWSAAPVRDSSAGPRDGPQPTGSDGPADHRTSAPAGPGATDLRRALPTHERYGASGIRRKGHHGAQGPRARP